MMLLEREWMVQLLAREWMVQVLKGEREVRLWEGASSCWRRSPVVGGEDPPTGGKSVVVGEGMIQLLGEERPAIGG